MSLRRWIAARVPVVAALAGVATGSCARAPAASAPPLPEPVVAASSASPVVPSPSASAGLPSSPLRAMRVSALAPTRAPTHVEVKFPYSDLVVRLDRVEAFALKLDVDALADGHDVVVVLDDGLPARLSQLPRSPTLGDLPGAIGAGPGRGLLRPGAHWITAAAIDARGAALRPKTPGASRAPFARVRFHVGQRGTVTDPASVFVRLAPLGTVHGRRTFVVDGLTFRAAGAAVPRPSGPLTVTTPGATAHEARGEGLTLPLEVSGAPGGDLTVAVGTYHGPVTVNPDGPAPERR